MSAHVNEYIPGSRDVTRGVQIDPRKLKFNNIQSCIAVFVCVYNRVATGVPTVNRLVGVHVNTINLNNNDLELNIALSGLKKETEGELLDVYLVGPYDQIWAATRLATKLKYLGPRNIKKCNLAPPTPGGGSDKDVKVEAAGTMVRVFSRDCVKWDSGNSENIKDKYDPAKGGTAYSAADFAAGRHQFANDRDAKPWTLVTNFYDLPV